MEHVRANRARISELEDAYIMSRYTGKHIAERMTEELIMLAEEIIKPAKVLKLRVKMLGEHGS